MSKKRTKQPMSADDARDIGEVNSYFVKRPIEEILKDCFDRYASDAEFRADRDKENQQQYDAGDPLDAWYGYYLARRAKQPVPEWVMSYLDGVACGLLYSKNQLGDCALHLGFPLKDGGSSPFKRGYTVKIRILAVAEVGRLLSETPEKSVDEACDEVAKGYLQREWETNVAGDTVKKWYNNPKYQLSKAAT